MITVFYEDQRGQRNEFGLHRFVCQLVLDRTEWGVSVYEVERSLIQGVPLKGNGNVLNRCKRDLPRLANRTRKVFAVYDQDRAPELLNLKGPQCRSVLRDGLTELCEPQDALEVILIDRNIETVIGTIRDSGLAGFIAARVFEGALGKNPLTRDSVFIQCATSTTQAQRADLLGHLPDIDRLVQKIADYMMS